MSNTGLRISIWIIIRSYILTFIITVSEWVLKYNSNDAVQTRTVKNGSRKNRDPDRTRIRKCMGSEQPWFVLRTRYVNGTGHAGPIPFCPANFPKYISRYFLLFPFKIRTFSIRNRKSKLEMNSRNSKSKLQI